VWLGAAFILTFFFFFSYHGLFAYFTFDDGTTINGGHIDIGPWGELDVEYGTNGNSHGAAFHGVDVKISEGGVFEVGESKASGTVRAAR